MPTSPSFLRCAAASSGLLFLSACATLGPVRQVPALMVAPSERLFLEVAPFDSAARADLARAGLDPAAVEADLKAELRYQFALRRQEEARDADDAAVSVRMAVRRLQPGSGNSGAFGSFTLTSRRRDKADSIAWEWRPAARDNVPAAHAGRHLARETAAQAMARLKTRPTKREPPPPLVLM